MYYSLCVATDFQGHKVNLQFFFDSNGPQLAQLLSRATEAFNQYFRSKGIVDRPFSITTAVIFNEARETWDRLERSAQLVHNGQVYLFQPDVLDMPAEIPDPISASVYLTDYVSPRRSFINQSTVSSSTPNRNYNGNRSASPGAQIPASYDPYYRQRYHDQPAAYYSRPENNNTRVSSSSSMPRGYNSSSNYQNNAVGAGSPSYSSVPRGDLGRNNSGFYGADFGGSPSVRRQPITSSSSAAADYGAARRSSSKADLESNPDYQALMARVAASQPRRLRADGNDGPSIFAEERQHEAELSRLPLDTYREVARTEATEFTPSPSRERTY